MQVTLKRVAIKKMVQTYSHNPEIYYFLFEFPDELECNK